MSNVKPEHKKMVRENFTLTRALFKTLTSLTAAKTRNKSEIVREALVEWCEKRKIKISKD